MKTSEKTRNRRHYGIKRSNEQADRHECILCGYIYDDSKTSIIFADLPDGYLCPLCLAGKGYFEKV